MKYEILLRKVGSLVNEANEVYAISTTEREIKFENKKKEGYDEKETCSGWKPAITSGQRRYLQQNYFFGSIHIYGTEMRTPPPLV